MVRSGAEITLIDTRHPATDIVDLPGVPLCRNGESGGIGSGSSLQVLDLLCFATSVCGLFAAILNASLKEIAPHLFWVRSSRAVPSVEGSLIGIFFSHPFSASRRPRTSSTLLHHAFPCSHPSLPLGCATYRRLGQSTWLRSSIGQALPSAIVHPHPTARTRPLLRTGTTGPAPVRRERKPKDYAPGE